MRKLLRILLWTFAGLIAVAVCGLFILYRAWSHEPEFYVEALNVVPEEQQAAGDELVKNVLELRNDVQREGRWEATFTEEQINGWLAFDLPNKFADAVPASIQKPRVAITPEQVLIACRYKDENLSSVISLSVDIQLTEEANQIAIRIRKARAGSLPIPLNRFIDQLAKAAKHSEFDLRWVQEEGDPVALIRIPSEHESLEQNELRLESIELGEGKVRVVGRSGEQVAAEFFNGSTLADQFPPRDAEPAKLISQ